MLSRATLRASARVAGARRTGAVMQSRAWSNIKDEHQYQAHATSHGSRANGISKLDNGTLEVKMRLPKAMGGSGEHHNPEELFGMAYSTCFLSALGAVYKQKFGTKTGKAFSDDAIVKAEVVIGNATNQAGFMLGVKLSVPFESLKSCEISKEDAETLLKEAHEICPYSRAINGNVETQIELV